MLTTPQKYAYPNPRTQTRGVLYDMPWGKIGFDPKRGV